MLKLLLCNVGDLVFGGLERGWVQALYNNLNACLKAILE